MKNRIYISIYAAIIITTISSCKKSSNSPSGLNSTVKEGNWRITNYIDSGSDETFHYSDYVFKFNSNDNVVATKGGNTTNGTWNSSKDDSKLKLNLNFAAINPFEELNNDWYVTQQTSSTIKLEDVSGGNGGTDYLTFTKN